LFFLRSRCGQTAACLPIGQLTAELLDQGMIVFLRDRRQIRRRFFGQRTRHHVMQHGEGGQHFFDLERAVAVAVDRDVEVLEGRSAKQGFGFALSHRAYRDYNDDVVDFYLARFTLKQM
jgi:hypothetical protein